MRITTKYFNSATIGESKNNNSLNKSFSKIVSYYEQFIGLSEVQKARNEVNQCESNLFQAQQDRREKQSEIRVVQNKLKEIHSELDRTLRGEDKYLRLITEEHAAIKKEREMMNIYEELETREREAFNVLSNKVRVSHEREREREERTKYWSLIGSLFGALLGILGTTIATELRMKHIREMIPSGQEIKPLLDEMVQMVRGSQGQVSEFLENLTKMFNLESPMLLNSKNKFNENNVDITENDFIKILGGLKEQNSALSDQMNELKRLLNLERIIISDNEENKQNFVFIGDSMEAMLQQTERNIESKMKLQTLAFVVG
uniref:Coiled-coil domain-containing protein 51 n=1 Tax=Meloidogyne floridensis TaxID=298350 RepID=A0A915NFS3_9BILA